MMFPCEAIPIPEAESESSGSRSVNKSYLVNKLNYLNFQDESIEVHLKHNKYDNTITLPVKPLPCAGERLDCSWIRRPGLQQVLSSYSFKYLLMNDGKKFLMVAPKLLNIDEEGLSVLLPMKGREFRMRRIRRHPSSGIGVQLTQDGALFQGTLADFTPVSLRVEGSVATPQTFKWISPRSPVNLHLYLGKQILYSGPCDITRESFKEKQGAFVLSCQEGAVRRFNAERYLRAAQQLIPSPSIIFEHPLIGKTVNLKVTSLTGWALTVQETEENSVLMTGMIIPTARLNFGHALNFTCRVQVVSRTVRRTEGDDEGVASCDLVIMDMDIHEHVKLLSILHQASNENSYVCSTVDMDALWDFFFETGFIYPEKYAHFQANKGAIKKIYHRLYGHNPHIARHFTYQDKGVILGHVAMVRFYENSWMIHHHAARKTVSLKAGMAVLHQIGQYVDVLRNFYFAHLNYVYCYFRPENKFPNRVFGGVARHLNDQKRCSLDRFAFSHFIAPPVKEALPEPWQLKRTCPFDLRELGSFYGFTSGGLMMDAFDLRSEDEMPDSLDKEYQKLGFRKEKHLYSLHHEGSVKAIIMAHATDAGFNMADLTNCATLIVLDESIPAEVMQAALGEVAAHYDGEMPVLTYPYSYAENGRLPVEKTYALWILDLRYLEEYFEFTESLFAGGGRKTEDSEMRETPALPEA
ncbi:pilus assembly protein PilZ [Geomonas sp. RF6]|uniref:pilus assembly protein PilZ n=1 Tax=Geomonas sp. RF6 TaxID=2897342 RepID=UPI001E630040|nr:pilus assembly protein PilZ [Geomonas sp. RF6]UFS68771.1 pilus assembly protein PilZ [Geomonas sp. RF6]